MAVKDPAPRASAPGALAGTREQRGSEYASILRLLDMENKQRSAPPPVVPRNYSTADPQAEADASSVVNTQRCAPLPTIDGVPSSTSIHVPHRVSLGAIAPHPSRRSTAGIDVCHYDAAALAGASAVSLNPDASGHPFSATTPQVYIAQSAPHAAAQEVPGGALGPYRTQTAPLAMAMAHTRASQEREVARVASFAESQRTESSVQTPVGGMGSTQTPAEAGPRGSGGSLAFGRHAGGGAGGAVVVSSRTLPAPLTPAASMLSAAPRRSGPLRTPQLQPPGGDGKPATPLDGAPLPTPPCPVLHVSTATSHGAARAGYAASLLTQTTDPPDADPHLSSPPLSTDLPSIPSAYDTRLSVDVALHGVDGEPWDDCTPDAPASTASRGETPPPGMRSLYRVLLGGVLLDGAARVREGRYYLLFDCPALRVRGWTHPCDVVDVTAPCLVFNEWVNMCPQGTAAGDARDLVLHVDLCRVGDADIMRGASALSTPRSSAGGGGSVDVVGSVALPLRGGTEAGVTRTAALAPCGWPIHYVLEKQSLAVGAAARQQSVYDALSGVASQSQSQPRAPLSHQPGPQRGVSISASTSTPSPRALKWDTVRVGGDTADSRRGASPLPAYPYAPPTPALPCVGYTRGVDEDVVQFDSTPAATTPRGYQVVACRGRRVEPVTPVGDVLRFEHRDKSPAIDRSMTGLTECSSRGTRALEVASAPPPPSPSPPGSEGDGHEGAEAPPQQPPSELLAAPSATDSDNEPPEQDAPAAQVDSVASSPKSAAPPPDTPIKTPAPDAPSEAPRSTPGTWRVSEVVSEVHPSQPRGAFDPIAREVHEVLHHARARGNHGSVSEAPGLPRAHRSSPERRTSRAIGIAKAGTTPPPRRADSARSEHQAADAAPRALTIVPQASVTSTRNEEAKPSRASSIASMPHRAGGTASPCGSTAAASQQQQQLIADAEGTYPQLPRVCPSAPPVPAPASTPCNAPLAPLSGVQQQRGTLTHSAVCTPLVRSSASPQRGPSSAPQPQLQPQPARSAPSPDGAGATAVSPSTPPSRLDSTTSNVVATATMSIPLMVPSDPAPPPPSSPRRSVAPASAAGREVSAPEDQRSRRGPAIAAEEAQPRKVSTMSTTATPPPSVWQRQASHAVAPSVSAAGPPPSVVQPPSATPPPQPAVGPPSVPRRASAPPAVTGHTPRVTVCTWFYGRQARNGVPLYTLELGSRQARMWVEDGALVVGCEGGEVVQSLPVRDVRGVVGAETADRLLFYMLVAVRPGAGHSMLVNTTVDPSLAEVLKTLYRGGAAVEVAFAEEPEDADYCDELFQKLVQLSAQLSFPARAKVDKTQPTRLGLSAQELAQLQQQPRSL